MAEWFIAPVSKTGRPLWVSGVRIPLPPLSFCSVATTPDWKSRASRLSIWNDNKVTTMTGVYDDKVEEAITAKLREHEATKLAAERRMETARNEVAEAEQAVEHWQFALEDYRRSHGLPPQSSTPSPVLEDEYSHMGPTELVQYWADRHEGEVVVKELAKLAVRVGMSPNYRHASSNIYAVVKRKGYEKIGPGHFKKFQNGDIHNPSLPSLCMVSSDSRSVTPAYVEEEFLH